MADDVGLDELDLDDQTDDETEELSLDELAERTGVTPRTIRYYQSQHVLPKPRHVGHDARYSTEHLVRLQVIASLQERGLKLEAIKRLVGATASTPARSPTSWVSTRCCATVGSTSSPPR